MPLLRHVFCISVLHFPIPFISMPIDDDKLLHAPLVFAQRWQHDVCKIDDFSASVQKLTGFGAVYFAQHDYMALVHPDDLPALEATLRTFSLKPTQQQTLAPYRILAADNATRWVSETLYHSENTEIFYSYLLDVSASQQQITQLNYQYKLLKKQQQIAPNGILVMNDQHEIVSWNPRLLALWDISANLFDLPDNHEIMEVIKSKVTDPESFIRDINMLRQPDSPDEIGREIQLRNGTTLERYSRALFDDNHVYQGRVWFMHDITQRKLEERILRDSEQLFSLAVKAANDGIWSWDFQTDSIWFSLHWKEQLGYSDAELPNSFASWEKVIYPEDYQLILAKVRDFISGRLAKFELLQKFYHKQGHTVYIRNCAVCESDKHGNVVRIVGAHTDITRQRTIEQELRELTLTDALTQLHNQHSFLQQLTNQVARCKRYKTELCLILLDLDGFYAFNVAHGYKKGDEILLQFTDILRQNSRDVDICARYGGEEFGLLLPETPIEGGLQLINRLRCALTQLKFEDEAITACFGISTWTRLNHPAATVETFIKTSDQALHQAKKQGCDRIVVG